MDTTPFDTDQLRDRLAGLATRGVFVGTSSWKYPGWPGSRTNPWLVAARFLLVPGKTYERTVQDYDPFDSIKQVDDAARANASELIAEGTEAPGHRAYLFINNQLEGSAPWTIKAMVEASREALRRRRAAEPGSPNQS